MAPATTTKGMLIGSSVGSAGRIAVGRPQKADDIDCSDSGASSLDHAAPICSSSPGASCNGATAMVWHDDGDTTDDQDDAGWQLVAAKSSHKAGSSSCSMGGHGKAAVCGRCGMKGHMSSRCRQPHCSRCNKWWHTEEECARACHACGSLEHRISASTPLCKSYKCRECGLYGHVYAECPNIVCNLCKQVGHKALDCPSIICNICKQQGHKAVNCPNPRALQVAAAAGPAASGGKVACRADDEQQGLQLHALMPTQLRQSGSSCGSTGSPTSFAAAVAAAADGQPPAVQQQQQQLQQPVLLPQDQVPLAPCTQQPSSAAELQARQQQQSHFLSQLYKAAPDVAVALMDNSDKLQALFCVEPRFLSQFLHGLPQHAPSAQQALLEAVITSVCQQQQQQQQPQMPLPPQAPMQQHLPAWQQHIHATAGSGSIDQEHHMPRSAFSSSSGSTPASPATPKPGSSVDVADATQGIKPGDLAPQLAKQLVAEFGDMLPNRWQQLPSWRQLEARLSFPDGNYVQRRLQFREKRRQLQLLTLQMRAAAAAARQQQAAGRAAAGMAASRPTAAKAVRVVAQVPPSAVLAASGHLPASRPPGCAPSSYAAALAGSRPGPAAPAAATPAARPGPDEAASSAAGLTSSMDSSSSTAMIHALGSYSEGPASQGLAVCRRCGMMGHTVQQCVQPRCARCHLWWHTEAQCAGACQFCGSLDHQGDAEQPASCQSFRCKACKMFGHTASTCPHVQLHEQQQQHERAQQQQQQMPGVSPVATPTSVAAAPSSLSSSCNSISYQQLAMQTPASPLGRYGAASSTSSVWDSPLRPPDSPGLGQHGVKPKDLLPEHAKALQEEFPNALPPGWQQMASWRMVEERLRVVAVEGAVFSKRRQMWRDRRKHYQVLTAQALAAAARSAAASNMLPCGVAADSAAASAAGSSAATPAAPSAAAADSASSVAAAAASSDDSTLDADASSKAVTAPPTNAAGAEGVAVPAEQQQQQAMANTTQCVGVDAPLQDEQEPGQTDGQQHTALQQQPQAAPQAVSRPMQVPSAQHEQQQQRSGPHQLALLQRQEPEDLVPQWQQHRGSLFGLSDLPPVSGAAQLDGQAGSTFSCDTTSFCCSPIPAVTPSVHLSPLGPDALGSSLSNTPAPLPGSASCTNTPPVVFSGAAGQPVSRHPSGQVPQAPGPQQTMSGASPKATPMPTPRGAAAAMAAAAAVIGGPAVSAGPMGPYGLMLGQLPGEVGGGFSPVHYAAAAGVPPYGPAGYGGQQQQSSPMPMHGVGAGMGGNRGMPPGMLHMAGSPALYQQMLVAQRQSQLQQQMMLESPYAPRAAAGPDANGNAHPQMMVNLPAQQHQQQQARMQRQRRLEQAFMLQQASARQQAQPDDTGDAGELDDKLGVLGVLGLQ